MSPGDHLVATQQPPPPGLNRTDRRPPGRHTGAGGRSSRGQMSFDFLVGMGVLLLALGFIYAFVPGMFQPFAGDAGSKMIVADRSAAQLAGDLLVENPDKPALLNATCTESFFDETIPAGCRFDSTDFTDALGIPGHLGVNITIEDTNGDIIHARGGTPPAEGDTIVAERLVALDGDASRLKIRVW